jgi:hypothetical protein
LGDSYEKHALNDRELGIAKIDGLDFIPTCFSVMEIRIPKPRTEYFAVLGLHAPCCQAPVENLDLKRRLV